MEIEQLTDVSEADYKRLVVGYTSDEVYDATIEDGDADFAFRFRLRSLDAPFEKRWPFIVGQFNWYRSLLSLGLSFGARENGKLVGLVISGTTEWSKIVNVWELHMVEAHRARGGGRALLAAVEEAGGRLGYRAVSCETQNTNVPAIRFYRRVGYEPMAADVSFYSNRDLEQGEVSVFMRKAIG